MSQTPDPTPADPAETAAATQWLVHCAPGRTLVGRRSGEEVYLVKILESGSLHEAEEEFRLARSLARSRVVTYRSAGLDPITRKPSVAMEYCHGDNLARHLAIHGPMATGRAARLMADLAEVLADLHETPRPLSPHGVVHRDLKPSNLFLVEDPEPRLILIDLEHCYPRQGRAHEGHPSSTGFTGGSHGYAPPEAYFGQTPDPAFDVFGWSVSFFRLLTGVSPFAGQDPQAQTLALREGRIRSALLEGQPIEIRDLILAGLQADAGKRPDAQGLERRLRNWLRGRRDADRSLDRIHLQIHAAQFEEAASALARAGEAAPEQHSALTALLARRQALWQRLDPLDDSLPPADPAPDQADLPAAVQRCAQELPQISTLLQRFPRHPGLLARRQAWARSGPALLEQIPPAVSQAKMRADFDGAHRLLDQAEALALALLATPGGLALSGEESGHLPGPLQREPLQLLQRFRRDVENTMAVHAGLMTRLEAAEAALDLREAAGVVDEIARIYSGANQVSAGLKDRLHRLDFYLQRIAQPRPSLQQLAEQLAVHDKPDDLAAVLALQRLCAEQTLLDPGAARCKGGVRGLYDTMTQLGSDFPALHEQLAPARSALESAMEDLTQAAWNLQAEARDRLAAVPVPIRLVQRQLNRLDSMRMIECFVDLPERSRERLQDEIERLRLRLDQARTTRDNIARGAQEAMDRGHLTTALFDMARAVDGFDEDGEDPGAEAGLSAQLAEARQRKQDLESAMVENRKLAGRYLELLDDDKSVLEQRLAVLEERASVLERLIRSLGEEKGSVYRQDQREVMRHLMQERADHGDLRLDRSQTPEQRLNIAQETLHHLRSCAPLASSQEATGRSRRLLDLWEHKEETARQQISEARARVLLTQRRRSRRTVLLSVAGLVLILASVGGWQYAQAQSRRLPEAVQAFVQELGGLPLPEIRARRVDGKLQFPLQQTRLNLHRFHTRLARVRLGDLPALADLDFVEDAAQVLALLEPKTLGTMDPRRLVDQLLRRMQTLDTTLTSMHRELAAQTSWQPLLDSLDTFAQRIFALGLCLLVERGGSPAEFDQVLRSNSALVHASLSDTTLARIRGS